jgi:acetyl esterase/lipase
MTLLAVIILHLVSPYPLMNMFTETDGVAVTRDIAYGPGERRTLDVYAPLDTHGPAPVLVFVYGGRWETGSKVMFPFLGSTLAARGVMVVIPDYRLHPEVQFPVFVEDVAQAVAWAHRNAARFGGDPRRMFVMGHSSGAQMAALLALDPEYLRAAGLSGFAPSGFTLCGFIGLGGPYDFLPLTTDEMPIFGAPQQWPLSQPINYATGQAPPALLLSGTWDGATYPGTPTDPGNTTRLAAKLRAAGAAATATLYPDIGHLGLLASFSRLFAFLSPARADVLRFINEHQACGTASPG